MSLKKQRNTIVKHLSNGMKVKDIGEKMKYSPRTIEKEIEAMFTETKCKNAPHLVATFLRNKIIE